MKSVSKRVIPGNLRPSGLQFTTVARVYYRLLANEADARRCGPACDRLLRLLRVDGKVDVHGGRYVVAGPHSLEPLELVDGFIKLPFD